MYFKGLGEQEQPWEMEDQHATSTGGSRIWRLNRKVETCMLGVFELSYSASRRVRGMIIDGAQDTALSCSQVNTLATIDVDDD